MFWHQTPLVKKIFPQIWNQHKGEYQQGTLALYVEE